MTRNEGTFDRTLRMFIGAALLLFAILAGLPLGWAIASGALGAILVVTGAIGFCPLYALLGLNTCPLQRT